MDTEVRIALPEDYELLAELGRETFYETWRPVNTEEDMQAYMAKAFNPALIKSDIENNSVNTFLIGYVDGHPRGYAKLRRDRTYDEFKNEKAIEIERIYVLKDWHNKKIGKLLMDECLALAIEQKFPWIWLGVNVDNHKAINFYKRYGFEVFGEKNFQLGDAVDTDYLMKRAVNGER